MKIVLKILLFAALSAAVLFAAGRFGWRIAGFAVCDDPGFNYVEDVVVENGSIRITGGTVDSFSAYVGCVYRLSGGKLTLGIKHNALLGFLQRIGSFSIVLPTEGQPVTAVFLSNGSSERPVWAQADGVLHRTAP